MKRRAFIILLLVAIWLEARPLSAAGRPTYIVAFIPVEWNGSRQSFEAIAREQGQLFVAESGIEAYADVEFIFVQEAPNDVSLDDRWLLQQVIGHGLQHQPADRYVGLTDGDLAPGGDSSVLGWTNRPDAIGVVGEAGELVVSAHELGHTFGLCDEYLYEEWSRQDAEQSCPNPFPPDCPPKPQVYCDGLPASDGRNSIMGPGGLSGPYAYNQPSYDHLQGLFAELFAEAAPPQPGGSPTPGPTATPEPTSNPLNASMVFASPELVRLEPGGILLPLAPAPALHPDWSANGLWIAFSAPYAGNLDIYRVSARGGSPQRLTDSPGRDTHPAWSGDGERLIFVSDRDGASALYLLDLEDDVVEKLELPTPASWPAVSHDGGSLAFAAARDGDWELYQVSLDDAGRAQTDTVRRLTHSPGFDISPAWRHDGAVLAFASLREGALNLYQLNVVGRTVTRLTPDTGTAWSPHWLDEEHLLYQAYDDQGLNIWLLNVESGQRVLFSETANGAAWPAVSPLPVMDAGRE